MPTNLSTLPAILEIKNGEHASQSFSDSEYEQRLGLLRKAMADLEVDRVLFTSYQNLCYYADFLYCQFGRNYGLVVDDQKMTSVSANIDGGQPWRRTYGGENLVYTDWQRDNFFAALKQLIRDGDVIGIEFDHVTLQNRAKLTSAFPNSRFIDISEAVMMLRMIKSAEEIRHITALAEIADLGGAVCSEVAAVGVPEHEVALASTNAMVRAIAERFPNAELMDTWTWFQSGLNTDGAHNPVTSRVIEAGDILSLNCFPMVSGYYVALERTLFAGYCSDEHRRLWEINCRVHDAGKALLRPGARCGHIVKALNEIYEEAGLLSYRTFGYGHSFGVLCHYYGREAGLELREDIDTVLEPGMVVSMEPMIMIPEGKAGAGGYREHDILVITEEGNRNITGFPYGPEHNILQNDPMAA